MNSARIKTVKVCDYIILFSIYAIAFFLPISKGIIESFSILAIIAYLTKKFLVVQESMPLRAQVQHFPKSPLNWGILAYLLVCIFSIFSSSNTAISSRTLFSKILQDILFFFAVFETLNSRQRIRNTLNVLFLSSLVLGID